jgi:glycerophosphoryl diester phosphodiesterase
VKRLFPLIVFLGFLSCKKDPPLFSINNLNGNKVSILGHGGMGESFKYPMDTDESLNTALSIGSDGTECDIQMSLDSVLVIYHDGNLNERTLCEGIIADKNWPEFWGCHWASPFSYRLNMLALGDWYNSVKEDHPNAFITLDCKLRNGSQDYKNYADRFAAAIHRFIDWNKAYNKINVESSDIAFLERLRAKNSGIRTFYYTANIQDAIDHRQILTGVTIFHQQISSQEVSALHVNGLQVALFGMISENENMPAIMKDPDFVQCDKIIEMLKIFDKFRK